MTFDEIWGRVQLNIQMTLEEAKELYSCSETLLESSILVEIGTWKGASACIMGAARIGKKSKIYTIDNFRTDIFPEGRTNEEETFQYLVNSGIENLTLITGTSKDVSNVWKDTINLLFIDGDHAYSGIKADVKNWLPRVEKNGLVIFHDYDSHEEVTMVIHRAIEDKLITPFKKVGSLLVTMKS